MDGMYAALAAFTAIVAPLSHTGATSPKAEMRYVEPTAARRQQRGAPDESELGLSGIPSNKTVRTRGQCREAEQRSTRRAAVHSANQGTSAWPRNEPAAGVVAKPSTVACVRAIRTAIAKARRPITRHVRACLSLAPSLS